MLGGDETMIKQKTFQQLDVGQILKLYNKIWIKTEYNNSCNISDDFGTIYNPEYGYCKVDTETLKYLTLLDFNGCQKRCLQKGGVYYPNK